MSRCQFDERFFLPLPGIVYFGYQQALFANPGCTINSIEPAINLSIGQTAATPCRGHSADSNIALDIPSESLLRKAVLNPDAPDIPGKNNSMQAMEGANSNRLCSLQEVIDEMSNIAFCLSEFWRRDLVDREMQMVMSFPYILSMCIYYLNRKDDVLETADLSKGIALNTTSNVIGMLGAEWREGRINEKFSKELLINSDGHYRHQLGEEVSNIVKHLKTLQADNKSKSQRTEEQSDGQKYWVECKPDVIRSKPCIKDTRITVESILDMLASGMTYAESISDFPDLNASSTGQLWFMQ